MFTNVSPGWSRLFLISPMCVQNDFWRFCDAIKQKIKHFRSKNLQNWVFTFLNDFFSVILLSILYFYVSHDPNCFTNVSSEWSRLFLISSTCVQNDFWRFCDVMKRKIEHLRSKNLQNWVFTFLKWIFFVILLPILYFYVSHDPNFFTNVSPRVK